MIAPMYKAMTEGEFEITMTSRGEVKDVKIPGTSDRPRSRTQPRRRCDGRHGHCRGLQEDDVARRAGAAGEMRRRRASTWTTKVEMKNPAVGKQIVETTYRYEGTKDVEGRSCRDQAAAEDGFRAERPQRWQPQQPVQQISK